MFSTPQEVVDLVKENFDFAIERSHVFYYDASKNSKIHKKWKEIFDVTRKNFLEDVSTIPIANRAYRMRELDRIYGNQKRQSAKLQNPVEMRATLKQAAEEEGGAFTNRRELTGRNGEPVQIAPVSMDEWRAEQHRRREEAAKTAEMFEN